MRRKAPMNLPRLPLSAFSPPNSGTSESFLPGSAGIVYPERIIDGHVVATDGDLTHWKKEAGPTLSRSRVVLRLQGTDVEKTLEKLESGSTQENTIIGVIIPSTFAPEPASPPKAPSSKLPVSLSMTYDKADTGQDAILGLKRALETGKAVEIDVQCNITEDDNIWENFQVLLAGAVGEIPKVAPIVLLNLLPPPHDLAMPIVKLMNHTAFRDRITALSLIPNLYIKFLPPSWDSQALPTFPAAGSLEDKHEKEKKEWKRRIKMFLGPVLEAFGFQRVIFGSSPSGTSQAIATAGDWYDIARESLSELGVEQLDMNDVFSGNAQRVYGSS